MKTRSVSGFVFDEGSSQRRRATLRVDQENRLWLEGESEPSGLLSALRVPARVGNTARFFQLPDGRGFETSDNDGLDSLLVAAFGASSTIAHRLENNLGLVAVAGVLLIALVLLAATKGVPWAGDITAKFVPDDVRATLGRSTLEQIDGAWLAESKLSSDDRQRLRALFDELSSQITPSSRLLFRSSERLGANALALPDGTVVLTDDLVAISDNDDQLAAVLLHELAHVEFDHGLRSVLRQAGLSVLILLVTGDVSTSSTLIIMLPTVMLSLQYSREFELEADRFALERMVSTGIDPLAFAQIMSKLEASRSADLETKDGQGDETQQHDDGVEDWDYFSSHPATEDRIRLFEEAAEALKSRSR
ncbi:MAG: M48 family metallopeptidase [Pseudomonadota bacterium]